MRPIRVALVLGRERDWPVMRPLSRALARDPRFAPFVLTARTRLSPETRLVDRAAPALARDGIAPDGRSLAQLDPDVVFLPVLEERRLEPSWRAEVVAGRARLCYLASGSGDMEEGGAPSLAPALGRAWRVFVRRGAERDAWVERGAPAAAVRSAGSGPKIVAAIWSALQEEGRGSLLRGIGDRALPVRWAARQRGVSRPAVSVIIPTRDRAPTLRRCLETLARQRFDLGAVEVLVCDNGSADDTESVVRALRQCLPVRLLVQPLPGPAAARNLALDHARGDLALFLNDDTLLGRDALAAHVAVHAEQRRRRVAVLGSFTLEPRHLRSPFARLCEEHGLLFQLSSLRPGGHYGWEHFYTCNLSVPRLAVLEAGGFDEDFELPASEDLELGVRLGRQGYRVRFEPRCEAWHDHSLSVRQFCELHRRRGHGAVTLFLKHPETVWLNRADLEELLRAAHAPAVEAAARRALVDPIVRGVQRLSDEAVGTAPHLQELLAARLLPAARSLAAACMRDGFLSHPELYRVAPREG